MKKTLIRVLIIIGLMLVAGEVYLVLSKDKKDNTNYFLVRFNSNGGTIIKDKSKNISVRFCLCFFGFILLFKYFLIR